MYSLLCAVKFLHSANIMHRDLKPTNLLLNSNWTVTLCDMGFARSIPEEEKVVEVKKKEKSEIAKQLIESRPQRKNQRRSVSPHVVTRLYRPPEVILLQRHYDNRVDLWGTGVIGLELISILLEEDCPNPFRGDSCFPLSPIN